MTNIFIFLQEKDISFTLPPTSFVQLHQKEFNDLLHKSVLEVISISDLSKDIKIFNCCFVDKIKNIETANAFEKSRLVIQVYNNHDKMLILIQSPTIQQMSQQPIFALSAIKP